MSRIKIFTGHFGSGKTEIAINYALTRAKMGKKIAIVDIDIVNPYFCTRSMKDMFDKYGIKLIASDPNLSNAELMVVPGEVNSAFDDKSYEVVIDVGGDDEGAVVLGRYNKNFKMEDYDMYFVINNNRPLTLNNKDTNIYIKDIERVSRLKVNNLISNTNLSYETKIEHILEGDKQVSELSKELNIPHKYTVCRKDFTDKLKGKTKGELFPIDIYMKPPWR